MGRVIEPAPFGKEMKIRKVKTSLYPLSGILAMIAVALFITWMTATPGERDDIVIWATGQVGQEPNDGVRQIDWGNMPDEVIA